MPNKGQGWPQQVSLFHPPVRVPQWKSVEPAVQAEVTQLIAQMLKESIQREKRHKEVPDE
jgi:hypothetical protein